MGSADLACQFGKEADSPHFHSSPTINQIGRGGPSAGLETKDSVKNGDSLIVSYLDVAYLSHLAYASSLLDLHIQDAMVQCL